MKTKTTLLLNWYANPYHTPLFAAKLLGFYDQEGIQLAILETTDPADVTEIVGRGSVDFGLKAMIHTLAARAKGYPVTSIGTLLDEPPTGLLALKSSGIHAFADIIGKRIGYVGEFGKRIIDHLARHAGIDVSSYESVRVGMNVVDAIRRNLIDAGIGFINFQKIELETLCQEEAVLLRLDELAGLGCCCFCSIQYIVPEATLDDPGLVERFLRATRRGTAYTTEQPEEAFELLCCAKPQFRTDMYRKIFFRTLPFFSRTLLNVDRDWNKVSRFAMHLGVLDSSFDAQKIYTNRFVPDAPVSELEPIACCLA